MRDAHGPMEDITHKKRVVHAMEKGRWVRVEGQLDNRGSWNELIQVIWVQSYQIVQREAKEG